ncbi:hypothetical protein VNO77_42964 [Canavalia gladiata]|uniref:At1g61320/AtMIF1 LRR domain-containing protein n=1 Tax=Canavalia gladiata TaxID=3824 RepID=A0AAN9JTC9_CANGL
MTNNFDGLSLLPDSLLLIIISLLPFNEAVRTYILSKRWLRLWAKRPSIEFNEGLFVKPNESFYRRLAQRSAFLKFMTLWLDNRKEGVMEKFSLKLSNPHENFHEIIERCVAFVTKHGVKELELDFSNPTWDREDIFPAKRMALFKLPTHVYENRTIESLKLVSCSFLENSLINLHALKEVSFGRIEVTLNAITALLSNCKMIETLILKKCWNSTHFEIGDEGSRLKNLVVEGCTFQLALFKVNALNLCFFKYTGSMNFYDIKPPLALEEAHLDFNHEFGHLGLGFYLYDLIKDLSTARVVTICTYVLQTLPIGPKLRTECDMNTRHLIMKMDMLDAELRGVSFWLNSCPMLESLTFELGFGRILEDDEDLVDSRVYQKMWLSTISVYECLNSTLKRVEVNNFEGCLNGILFIYFLIRCGSVLQRVNINVLKGETDGDNRKVAFYREIEEFFMTTPRASSDLQISFRY